MPELANRGRVLAFCEPCDRKTPARLFIPTEEEWLPVNVNGEPTTAPRSNRYCEACGTGFPAGRVLHLG